MLKIMIYCIVIALVDVGYNFNNKKLTIKERIFLKRHVKVVGIGKYKIPNRPFTIIDMDNSSIIITDKNKSTALTIIQKFLS